MAPSGLWGCACPSPVSLEERRRGYMARPMVLAVALATVLSAIPVYAGQRARRAQQPTLRQASQPMLKQVTRASWYGQSFRGRRTASGASFNPTGMTAAHRTLRIGSKVRVNGLRTGRSLVVQITDRGPYLRGRGIDLSYAAAQQLGTVRCGIARVRVEVLRPEEQCTKAPIVTAFDWPKPPWLPAAIVE